MTRFSLPPPPPGWGVTLVADDAWLEGYISHFSASGLRLLKVCPEAWRRRYICGDKERPGEALVLGSAVHSAIGHSHQQKIQSHEDLPVSEVVEFFHDAAWPEAVSSDGGEDAIRWDNKPDDVRRDGERVTQAYHHKVSPTVQPIAVERRVEFVVPDVPVKFLGYVDWEEETHVGDLKTGKQVTRKPDANWKMQGAIYTAATGKPTHFHSVSRAKTPSIATPLTDPLMVTTLREAQRETIETILSDFAAQVEFYFARYGPENYWPTTGVWADYRGGPACGFCGFRPTCPAWRWERELVPLAPLAVEA